MTLKKFKTFLCIEISKQKRDDNNQDVNEFSIKMFKIIFAIVTLSADKENSAIRFNIFTFIIYAETVKDSTWKKM